MPEVEFCLCFQFDGGTKEVALATLRNQNAGTGRSDGWVILEPLQSGRSVSP